MNILFVCTVNTCRSQIAEAIFNTKANDKKYSAKSAGLSIIQGSTLTKNTIDIVNRELKLDISNKTPRNIDESLIEESDLIITMTDYSKEYIIQNYQNVKKINTISEYTGIEGEIIDPYGSSINVYEKIYRDLEKRVSLLLDKIKKEGSV